MALEIVSAPIVELGVLADQHTRLAKPALGPHRALQLPEVVRLILKYAVAQPLNRLPQISGSNGMYVHPSDKWVEQWWTPLLVCKTWYFLCQDLILNEISWNHDQDTSLDKLSTPRRGLRRFVLYSPDTWFLRDASRAALNSTIDNIISHLAGNSFETVLAFNPTHPATPASTTSVATDNPRILYPIENKRRASCTLRELSLRGDFTFVNELSRFLNNITITQSLTLLELAYEGTDRYLELNITLLFGSIGAFAAEADLPSSSGGLRHITESGSMLQLNSAPLLPHLQHLLIRRVHLTDVPAGWTPCQPSLLKTLRMSQIKTNNTSLETLLNGLCGAWLENLEVTMIALPPEEQLTYPTRPYLQNPATLRRIAETCPRLREVKLQKTLETRTFEALQEIYTYFPLAQQATLVICRGYNLDRAEQYQMNRHLTTLRIHTFAGQATTEIHAFLCSDLAESLEELYLLGAGNTQYGANLLMPRTSAVSTVNGNSGNSHGCNDDVALGQPIWKCRRLKMLTIGLERSTPEGYTHGYEPDAAMRQIFAFLVIHCPKLNFLEISCSFESMSPETGLCFLSRLADLERLVLGALSFRCRVRSVPSSLSSNHSLPSSSSGSTLIPLLARARTPSAQDSTRWMVTASDSLQDEHELGGGGGGVGLSSLKLCRRIAKLDSPRGHFDQPYGQGILWPMVKDEQFGNKNIHMNVDSGKVAKGAFARSRLRSGQQRQEIPSEACWRKLNFLMVRHVGFHGDNFENMNDEVMLFGRQMPTVKTIFAKGV
ncbi:hypothetical protein BGW42_004560 [Actinomortierella wolfii]|nr:hypothetical protein BGW42_004560 [Actinomortierella wolfii]